MCGAMSRVLRVCKRRVRGRMEAGVVPEACGAGAGAGLVALAGAAATAGSAAAAWVATALLRVLVGAVCRWELAFARGWGARAVLIAVPLSARL